MEKQSLIIMQIIWLALFASMLIYGAVLFQVLGHFAISFEFDFQNQLTLSILVLAAGSLLLSFYLPKIILSAREKHISKNQSPTERHFSPLLIRLVLLESIAVYGLALSFVTKKYLYAPFFFVAAIGFLMHFPTARSIESSASSNSPQMK